MRTQSSELRRQFQRDGYVIVRRVLGLGEIAALREAALQTRDADTDLLSHPSSVIRALVADPRLADIARVLLDGQPVYFGDSTVSIGTDRFGGWHKDNADRYDGNAPDWRSDYDVLRFGIYLQDHFHHSGGLMLRRGSHNHPDTSTGAAVYARTRPGDVVVWNLRTTHAGHGVLFRFAPGLSLHSRITFLANRARKSGGKAVRRLVDFCFAEPEAERVALFMSIGRAGAHLDRLVTQLKTRSYWRELMAAYNWAEEDLAAIRAAGKLSVVPPEELGEFVPDDQVHQEYRRLPY